MFKSTNILQNNKPTNYCTFSFVAAFNYKVVFFFFYPLVLNLRPNSVRLSKSCETQSNNYSAPFFFFFYHGPFILQMLVGIYHNFIK